MQMGRETKGDKRRVIGFVWNLGKEMEKNGKQLIFFSAFLVLSFGREVKL